MRRTPYALIAVALACFAGVARGETVAGVCPDGSAFVVQSRDAAPCARAKFVDPSDLPPLRPELLPHPYTWYVDQQESDPNNPYNLIEPAEQIRAAAVPTPEREGASAPAEPLDAAAPAPVPALTDAEMRDLVRLVALRQQVAPASITVADALGREELHVRLAHSDAFELRVREELGVTDRRVILFSARSVRDSEFHPNFLVVSGGATFRPDPTDPREVGFIVGEGGPLEAGYLALGYLLVPERFDPALPLDYWWNDRSLNAALRR